MSAFNVRFIGGGMDGHTKVFDRAPQDGEQFHGASHPEYPKVALLYEYDWNRQAYIYKGYELAAPNP